MQNENNINKWQDFRRRLADNDIWYSFKHTPMAYISAITGLALIALAVFAPLVAPQNPFDLASLDLFDASMPPSWMDQGDPRFLLGTDDQGRGILSTIFYGLRISLFVGFTSVFLSLLIGVSLGLISGYIGGRVDAVIMRIADVQLSFPAILIALLIDGVFRTVASKEIHEDLALYVVIFAIANQVGCNMPVLCVPV